MGHLDLSLGQTAHSALSAIRSLEGDPSYNCKITSVVVRNNCKGQSKVSPKELQGIFEGIARVCRNLENLRILFDTIQDLPLTLPISALVAFFQQRPTSLKTVQLTARLATQDCDDFAQLEAAIGRFAPETWREVRLEFCEPAKGTLSLDPLVDALASAPNLEQFTLSGTSLTHNGVCSGPSLEALVRSGKLKVLALWGGKRKFQSEHICSLAKTLGSNTSLRELTLHASNLCPRSGRALAKSLALNKSLERLTLNLTDSPSSSTHSDYVTTATLIAAALKRHNRTLKRLSLDYSSSDETGQPGDSLDYDSLDCGQMHKIISWWHVHAVIQAFTQMLHCNPVVEALWMNHAAAGLTSAHEHNEEEDELCEREGESTLILTSEMGMLLRLNRFGISRNLFAKYHVSSKDWMDALVSQNNDLNALYYLVSRNPLLCCNLCVDQGAKRKTNFKGAQTTKRQKTISEASG